MTSVATAVEDFSRVLGWSGTPLGPALAASLKRTNWLVCVCDVQLCHPWGSVWRWRRKVTSTPTNFNLSTWSFTYEPVSSVF